MLKRALTSSLLIISIALPSNLSAVDLAAAPNKNKSAKKSSPFLITSGLPHYTMILKKMWDDPKLALTPKQKKRLLEIRKETLGKVMPLKRKVLKLQREIVKSAMSGAKPDSLSSKVEKLAKLKAKATKIHLLCVYDTKQVLTPKQLKYIHSVTRKK